MYDKLVKVMLLKPKHSNSNYINLNMKYGNWEM